MNPMLTLKQHAYQAILNRLHSGAFGRGMRLSDDIIVEKWVLAAARFGKLSAS